MALSLGFHIIFAAIGVAMPFFMAASHYLYLKHDSAEMKALTKAWSKGVAIFFAVGAVSGTALSFELGLLWPRFMLHAGPIIGMPFSWEGTAFFLEAIAIGIFLYGWDKVSPWVHWGSGLLVGISGVASAFFVICANAWMNSPAGFDWNNGNPTNIDPWAAMFNDAAFVQGLHMVVAAFEAVGFAVAGLHALLWLRGRRKFHLHAGKIAFVFAAVSALVQPLIGDFSAKGVARRQPTKLAAMEALFHSQNGAPLLIGGIPDVAHRSVHYAIELPHLLSFLAYEDFSARVQGLEEFPEENWPPVAPVHFAFQIMVGLGSALALLGAVGLLSLWKKPALFSSDAFQKLLVIAFPLGFVALEAGWVVTEVGRQPWILYGLLRTRDALTPRPGIAYSLIIYFLVYAILAFVVAALLWRQTQLLREELISIEKAELP